jgi:hypothetical protein
MSCPPSTQPLKNQFGTYPFMIFRFFPLDRETASTSLRISIFIASEEVTQSFSVAGWKKRGETHLTGAMQSLCHGRIADCNAVSDVANNLLVDQNLLGCFLAAISK